MNTLKKNNKNTIEKKNIFLLFIQNCVTIFANFFISPIEISNFRELSLEWQNEPTFPENIKNLLNRTNT